MYWRIDEESDICVDLRNGSDKMLELQTRAHTRQLDCHGS
jgi:hypothetical protein